MLVGIITVMLALNVQLALVSFSIIPIILAITIWYNKKAKENFRWVRSLIGRINAYFAENISGMRLVQIFVREKEKYKEFLTLNEEYNKANRIMVFLNAVFRPVNELINSLAITLLIWFSARPILEGGLIELGMLYAFIDYSRRFFAPINDLADRYTNVLAGRVAAERIFELLDDNYDYEETTDEGLTNADIKGKIEFKDVWFSYTEEEWVLKGVSFTINPGENIAFVGATGSGKTTVISLLCRFYKPQKGEILIDDININDYALKHLRRSIGVVMQDVFLFAGDIAYNIRLNKDIDDAKVLEAAKFVNAHDFISRLQDGYQHQVKERAVTFSSGERQLISFARAIAYNPKIMILDEATANIDTGHEIIIQDSLLKISKNRSTITIAHRLSTIKSADGIIVMHKGKIREQGNHASLLQNDGIYKKLYELSSV